MDSNKDLLKQQIDIYNKETIENRDILERQQLITERYLKQQDTSKEEIRLWENFQNIVNKARDKNNKEDKKTYFSFDYIEQLGVEYDLLLIYGGKNIGKTYSMSTYMKKVRKEDPNSKFLILRNTREEVEQGLKIQLLEGEEGPFCIKSNTLVEKTGVWAIDEHIEDEEQEEPPRKRGRPKKQKESLGGYVAHLTGNGLRARQGASYKDLKCVGWDECNDTGDRGIFKEDTFTRLLIFLLSMERNNREKLKVIMTGNLLRYSSGMVGNMILDKLNIPYDAKLKYIKKKTNDVELKLLYINTGQAGELFDGVKSQKFSQLFGADAVGDLESNRPESESSKVLNISTFTKGEPIFSFVFKYKEERIIIYLAKYDIHGSTARSSTYYILHLDNFNKRYIYSGYKPFSDSRSLTNAFGIISNIGANEIGKFIHSIFNIMKERKLFYSSDLTRKRGEDELEEYLETRYKPIMKNII